LVHRVPDAQRLLREDVVDRVLKRDITQLFGTRNIADLEKLFIYVCLHSGAILNVARCASELGAHRQTVENHLSVLVDANLLYKLEQTAGGGKKSLKGRNKYFLVDAALRNAVLLSGREILDDTEESGRIVETAILRHLKAFYYQDLPHISYWKGRDDTEVDVVLRSPAYVIAAEIKYRSQLRERDLRGIRAFSEDNPGALCYVVTRRAEDFGPFELPDGRIGLKVPAHIFAYLIGQAERAAVE
jgi:predicted AAA+ superfamily ATPase